MCFQLPYRLNKDIDTEEKENHDAHPLDHNHVFRRVIERKEELSDKKEQYDVREMHEGEYCHERESLPEPLFPVEDVRHEESFGMPGSYGVDESE